MNYAKSWISLDLQDTSSWIVLNAKKDDDKREVCIRLTDGGQPYEITEDCSAVFSAQKSDGNRIYNDCVIEGNVIRYRFTEQTCAAVGVLACEVKLYDANGELLTSPRFGIYVEAPVFDDQNIADSSYEFNAIKDIIEETAKEYLEQNPVAIDPNLDTPNMAADAAVVGERLAGVEAKVNASLSRNGGDMGGNRITGLGDPVEAGDAVTKGYVDSKHLYAEATLIAGSWGAEAPYTQRIAVDGMLEGDRPHYGLIPDTEGDIQQQMEAFSKIDQLISENGYVTFVCNEKPECAVAIQMEVNR